VSDVKKVLARGSIQAKHTSEVSLRLFLRRETLFHKARGREKKWNEENNEYQRRVRRHPPTSPYSTHVSSHTVVGRAHVGPSAPVSHEVVIGPCGILLAQRASNSSSIIIAMHAHSQRVGITVAAVRFVWPREIVPLAPSSISGFRSLPLAPALQPCCLPAPRHPCRPSSFAARSLARSGSLSLLLWSHVVAVETSLSASRRARQAHPAAVNPRVSLPAGAVVVQHRDDLALHLDFLRVRAGSHLPFERRKVMVARRGRWK
jgi:hypothetical protein